MTLHHGAREILARGRRDDRIASGDGYRKELLKGLDSFNLLDINRFDAHPVSSRRLSHGRHERCTFAQIEGAVHSIDNFTGGQQL